MEYLPNFGRAKVQADNEGNNVLVLRTQGRAIRLNLAFLVADAAQQVKFVSRKSGVDTDLTGLMTLGIGGTIATAFNEHGNFETEAGAALVLYLENASAAVGGWINYQLV